MNSKSQRGRVSLRKIYCLPERYSNYIKSNAEKIKISESDMLRRIIDDRIQTSEIKDMTRSHITNIIADSTFTAEGIFSTSDGTTWTLLHAF
jgi:negative regulator of replication initiation